MSFKGYMIQSGSGWIANPDIPDSRWSRTIRGSGVASRHNWTTDQWANASWRRDKKYQVNNTIRSLTPHFVWFDDAIRDYMAPKLAKAMGDTGALIMTIARRSTRKHRRKRLAELTPYEREFYAPESGKRDSKGKFIKGLADRKLLPVMPGAPGEPARYTENGAIDFKHTILFGYDPQTRSVVCGRILLAGRRTREVNVPQLMEEGGMAPVSYGPHHGRMTYLAARPTMRLALAVALPRIEKLFKDDGRVSANTSGRTAQVTTH